MTIKTAVVLKSCVLKFLDKYFDSSIDLRVQAFNLLSFTGMAAGIFTGLFAFSAHMNWLHIALNFLPSVAAFLLLYFTRRLNCYRFSFLFTVITVFMFIFPGLFFTGGGYKSGMPCFFVFALVYTALMLDKMKRAIAIVVEFVIYIACVLTAYLFPETIIEHFSEWHYARDVIIGIVIGGSLLLCVILLYIRIYDNRQKQLEEANNRLNALNRIKTEFLQDIKHEIRTPLTAISLGADVIRNSIDTTADGQEALNALYTLQNEAMRLWRMINGMVELAIMRDNSKNREIVDFALMLNNCAEASRFQLEAKRNTLRVDISPDLPYVYAETEQLERVPTNLLSNAINCTQGGKITLEASAEANYITARVCDTGEGISQEIIPHIFERGVSGKGGKGFGLSICKTIVEAHGGTIEIESEKGNGTVVTFTIPVYGGQDKRGEMG